MDKSAGEWAGRQKALLLAFRQGLQMMKSDVSQELAARSAREILAWRKSIGLSQRKAAAALGMTLKNYQILEWGHNAERGIPVVMTKRIALACAAIREGVEPLPGWR